MVLVALMAAVILAVLVPAVIPAALVALGQVFGVNVTALIGGLGIGGLAVAFAAKESLENLIASFIIFFDNLFNHRLGTHGSKSRASFQFSCTTFFLGTVVIDE